MRFNRTRWIPKESIPVEHHDGLGIAYVYQMRSGYGVVAYGGKRNNHDFHYSFKTIEQAHDKIEGWFKGLEQHLELIAKYRSERYSGHNFKVGDIVTNSWGYDQTNVDWYRVAKTTAKFVWLQPISGATEQNGFMSGHSLPAVDTTSDDPTKWGFQDCNEPLQKHLARKDSVSMKYGSGSKWDGEARYESWYA